MSINSNFFPLRLLAAILITVSGTGQVAMLWFRELTGAALIDALLGVVYIIIGIGLLGQSRFTLFMAIAVPMAASVLILNSAPDGGFNMLQISRLSMDLAVIMCSAMVLANSRK
ncbi:MAG: hypothetical protein H6985_13445 [Pseudomonadales bacterium]|nr:hypothetical protein [Halioglobus sp.]MCP5130574.1 hypothetical protein [Pseudomonadales bacterium]